VGKLDDQPLIRLAWFNGVYACQARSKRTGRPCLQPAMANGRCRFHGGKSTGPRTADGLARSKRARWVHGERSQEAREQGRAVSALLAEVVETLKAMAGEGL